MAKLAGRWITVSLEDSVPTPRNISSDVQSIDIPIEYDEIDTTGFRTEKWPAPSIRIKID